VLNGVNEARLRQAAANLTAAFWIGGKAARRMATRGRGNIISIGSLTLELARATVARATVAPDTVAKCGIQMPTKALAPEIGTARRPVRRHRAWLYDH
jgi:NAD(P)-dependent dehydrogenase (short-subunit alcohol dehydrogenase family)